MEYLLIGSILIYKVKKGDTLASLSVRFNTTVENICELNLLKERLEVGQTVFIKPTKNSMRTAKPFELPYTFCRVLNYEHNL